MALRLAAILKKAQDIDAALKLGILTEDVCHASINGTTIKDYFSMASCSGTNGGKAAVKVTLMLLGYFPASSGKDCGELNGTSTQEIVIL